MYIVLALRKYIGGHIFVEIVINVILSSFFFSCYFNTRSFLNHFLTFVAKGLILIKLVSEKFYSKILTSKETSRNRDYDISIRNSRKAVLMMSLTYGAE